MRIIGGKFGGRRFTPPAKNWPTRPTTDYAKEALFNILQNRISFEETKMLDIFGGTGNHSYEFISRGCTDVTYVDRFKGCVLFVKKMSESLELHDVLKIIHIDAGKFLKTTKEQYNYIFAGPPYPLKWLGKIPDLIFENEILAESGLFVLEHNQDHSFKRHPRFLEERHYSGSYFSFFE